MTRVRRLPRSGAIARSCWPSAHDAPAAAAASAGWGWPPRARQKRPGADRMTPSQATRDTRLPPGPRLPTTVQAAIWALRPLAFLDHCAARHGDLFTLRIPRRPWVLVSDPEHVKPLFS